MAWNPDFEISAPSDTDIGQTLLVGISDFGLAGLTAVDYLTRHLQTQQIGHLKTRNLPDLLPFSDGEPRHPMRFYTTQNSELTLFISEAVLPVWVADSFSERLFEWIAMTGIQEITVLFGVTFPHTEDEHFTFHVGNEKFRNRHFGDHEDIDPLPGGFFDGVVGELMTRGLADGAPSTGTLVTPAHYPGPDLDGALRLIDAVESIYDVDVDEQELKESSERMRQHYQELAQRMQTIQESAQSIQHRDFPEDRMYM